MEKFIKAERPGVSVVINPGACAVCCRSIPPRGAHVCVCVRFDAFTERPRKGCFEVRVDGEVVLSLLDMPRPFKPLKALDMDQVGADVVEAIGEEREGNDGAGEEGA